MTTTPHPMVSIGLPVYNGESFIEETLDSLLGQDLTDLELIISDNASTDSTSDICRAVAAADPRVRYVRQSANQGAAWNYNHVVELARGRYFMWTGHDDIRHPTHLSRCVGRLEAEGRGTVLAYPRTTLINEQGEKVRAYEDGLDLPEATAPDRVRSLLRNLGLANAVFGVIRTDVLRATGLIRPFVYSDLVLLYELALRGRFAEVPEPLFSRRMHEEMSHRANPNAESRLAWFTGAAATGRPVLPRTRLFTEMVRTTLEAPLPRNQRSRCLLRLLQIWGPKYTKLIGKELVGSSAVLVGRGVGRLVSR